MCVIGKLYLTVKLYQNDKVRSVMHFLSFSAKQVKNNCRLCLLFFVENIEPNNIYRGKCLFNINICVYIFSFMIHTRVNTYFPSQTDRE